MIEKRQFALYSGGKEVTAPWYQRAEYPRVIAWWTTVEHHILISKIEVMFKKKEFTGPDKAEYVNGWGLWLPSMGVPLFIGSMGPVRVDSKIFVNVLPAFALHHCSSEERQLIYWALFNMEEPAEFERVREDMVQKAQEALDNAEQIEVVELGSAWPSSVN